jgi:NADPH-dependent 2,4-dienoyl-CoA reductase/sulfur reductase-like enzyme
VLRSLDDAAVLGAALAGTPRVVVIGAGFIGSEAASSARERGCEVTVLEALPAPLVRGLGPEIGAACGRLHAANGTALRCGVGVSDIVGAGGSVGSVRLDDGTEIPADVVVVGVGVSPATGWLEGSGLTLDDGIVCDATLAAGPPGVYAAGDCARWPNGALGGRIMRVEHWTNAAEQGPHAARSLLAGAAAQPYESVPFVWSDQYGSRIQVAGHPSGDDDVEVLVGSLDGPFLAGYRQGDALVGVAALDLIRPFVKFRLLLQDGGSWADGLELAETFR